MSELENIRNQLWEGNSSSLERRKKIISLAALGMIERHLFLSHRDFRKRINKGSLVH